jgi:hypothetical protein
MVFTWSIGQDMLQHVSVPSAAMTKDHPWPSHPCLARSRNVGSAYFSILRWDQLIPPSQTNLPNYVSKQGT